MNFLNIVLDFIFPSSCGICGILGQGYLCKKCEEELQKYMYQNDKQINDIFHLLKYEGLIRQKMIAYKFNDKAYLYNLFSCLVLNCESACDFFKRYDMILPVPVHAKRKRERGYNQSELIAKKVAKDLKIEIQTDVIEKIINTQPQSTLGKEKRLKNVKNVYIVKNIHKIIGKRIVILDDIYTTGATTQECKNILLDSGAKRVGIFTIARD